MAEAPAPTPDHEQQPEPVVLGADELVQGSEETAAPAPTEAIDTEAVVTEDVVTEAVATEAVATEPAPEPVAAPESAPEPEAVTPEPTAPADGPSVASTLEVPANPQAAAAAVADQEGGEWELLVQKLRHWIASGQLQEQWQAARTPLSLVAGLIAVLLVLRVYSAVLNVLDSIPLLPGLLELAGLVAVVQFSLTRLVRSEDRREVIGGLRQRWQSFRGRG